MLSNCDLPFKLFLKQELSLSSNGLPTIGSPFVAFSTQWDTIGSPVAR